MIGLDTKFQNTRECALELGVWSLSLFRALSCTPRVPAKYCILRICAIWTLHFPIQIKKRITLIPVPINFENLEVTLSESLGDNNKRF